MNNGHYWRGMCCAGIAFLEAHFSHHDCAVFAALMAVACWVKGVCACVVEHRKAK